MPSPPLLLPSPCLLLRLSELVIRHHCRQPVIQRTDGSVPLLAVARAGAKEARLLALEAEQFWAKRLAEITTHLDPLDDNELDLRLRPNQRATGRLRMGKANHRSQGG